MEEHHTAWRVTRRGENAAAEARRSLDELLRDGAQQMLQKAIEVEVDEYLARHEAERDPETGDGPVTPKTPTSLPLRLHTL